MPASSVGSVKHPLRLSSLVAHAVIIVLGFIFIFPFLWLLSSSLKTMTEATALDFRLVPSNLRFDNYAEVFRTVPFFRYLLNTLYLSLAAVVGQVVTSSMVAYSFTHVNWRGGRILFPIVIATMLIPYQVTMIPVYIIFNDVGLVGTFWPLIIPSFTAGAFNVFLMRQFFLTLPQSLMQAAKIDGASHVRVFLSVVAPLCKPVIATIAVFNFLWTWSDFMGPLIYLNRPELYTISIGLQAFIMKHYIKWHLIMAASAVPTVPMIVLFFIAQKQFIEGITMTGIKG